jgi:molybdopterin converting factor small subunit
MARVELTAHLRRFFPDLAGVEVAGSTVAELIAGLEELHPGLAAYLVDERGALRQHVNVFIGRRMVSDRTTLSDAVRDDDHVHVFQALSGG